MTLDLDTFLVALYTTVDDLYQEHCAKRKPTRCGRLPRLSDSEVLTLAICAQWRGTSERDFIRYASEHWLDYFPDLLSQSAFNRRSRDLSGVLSHLIGVVAERLGAYGAPYEALDCVPVPLMRRCRGKRRRLFGDEAAIGRGGSDRDWYYGCKLLLSVTDEGVATGFMLAPADTEDRWIAESLLCWRSGEWAAPLKAEDMPPRHNGKRYVGPTGPVWPKCAAGSASAASYLTDNGFFGAFWQSHWREDYNALVLTPKDYRGEDAHRCKRQHSSWKQIVETMNGHLERTFGLHFPGARSKWGLLTRVSAKILSMNIGILLNRLFGRSPLAFATLFNC